MQILCKDSDIPKHFFHKYAHLALSWIILLDSSWLAFPVEWGNPIHKRQTILNALFSDKAQMFLILIKFSQILMDPYPKYTFKMLLLA